MLQSILHEVSKMNTYTLTYEYDKNLKANTMQFEADDICHAVEQFNVFFEADVIRPNLVSIQASTTFIVSLIKNGVIDRNYLFYNTEEAESKFVDLVIEFDGENQESDELNGALDDGYWEVEGQNISVCISHPE
jgi:hypothetical protein